MPSRHEEKYIIDYLQYVMLRQRAMELLSPDENGQQGSYVITSLYYDDPMDNALYEKLDGLAEHRKFRVRTYDCSDRFIKLERKDKHGILTEKQAASITRKQLPLLDGTSTATSDFSGKAYDLAAQMQAGGLVPTVAVRYKRDAFFYAGTDLRLTFDTELEAIAPDPEALFCAELTGIPVLSSNEVIMEIKYGDYVPAFVRKMTAVHSKQLSVSKYALCREKLR